MAGILNAITSVAKALSNASNKTTSNTSSGNSVSGLSADDNARIQTAKTKYAEAQARGDTAGMQSAHAEAEAVRSNYGYSGGTDGNQYVSIFPQSTYQNDLDRYKKIQEQVATGNLKSAYDKQISALDKQKSEIAPMYQNQRNIASANSQLGAKNFAEYLANRGLTRSGASAQGEINRISGLQNTFGNLGVGEAKAYNDIETAKTNAGIDFNNNIANATNQIEADYFAKVLEKNEQDRLEQEALKKQSYYQYANDYQARLNELKAQGLEGSKEYLTLQALRGEKVAEQNSYKVDNMFALMQQGVGDPYLLSQYTGLSVEDVQSVLQRYKDQIQLENQMNLTALEGAKLDNKYKTKQIANYGRSSGGSSGGSSNSGGLTYSELNSQVGNIIDNSEDEATGYDLAATQILSNAKSENDVISVAVGNGITPERMARAMAKMGYDDQSIILVAQKMMGVQGIDENYANGILSFARN